MSAVLVAENHILCRELPIDRQIGVIPGDSSLCLRAIELVALVLEYHLGAENSKSVGKPFRDEKLSVILCSKLRRDIFAEGGGIGAYIDRHIEHLTLNHPHQLGLGLVPLLEMEPADHSVARFGLIVLDEMELLPRFEGELPLIETFEKVSSVVPKHLRLDDQNPIYICFNYFHFSHPQ